MEAFKRALDVGIRHTRSWENEWDLDASSSWRLPFYSVLFRVFRGCLYGSLWSSSENCPSDKKELQMPSSAGSQIISPKCILLDARITVAAAPVPCRLHKNDLVAPLQLASIFTADDLEVAGYSGWVLWAGMSSKLGNKMEYHLTQEKITCSPITQRAHYCIPGWPCGRCI